MLTLKMNAVFAKTEIRHHFTWHIYESQSYMLSSSRENLRTKINRLYDRKVANCFVMFLEQENPFQRAERRQQRSGSLSSSSTVGENSDSTSSSTTTSSNATSTSPSQDHTAVAITGIFLLFCLN
jgi:hypothetical protein